MSTPSELRAKIWEVYNLLRGSYKRNEYRKVILSLTVLRRFDCVLAPTKAHVLEAIQVDIVVLKKEIVALLKEVTA